MQPHDGVLHVIPVPSAIGYSLVNALVDEIAALDAGESLPPAARLRGDDVVLPALSPIPAVFPGDTVWWHGDLLHSVADATNRDRWGNVLYVPCSPRCPRNDAYAATMLERFVAGSSPIDFPQEDFEVDFVGRATPEDLNATGRDQFGVEH
jgi:hypothetical protein